MVLVPVLSLLLHACDAQDLDQPVRRTADPEAIERNDAGIAAADKGDYAAALEHFRAALDTDPDYVDARLNLARNLAGLGELDDALLALETLVAAEPDHPQFEAMRAMVLEAMGRIEEAHAAYRKATELYEIRSDPERPDPEAAVDHAVVVFLARGKVAGLNAIHEVLKHYPEYRPAVAALERMRQDQRDHFVRWIKRPEPANAERN